MPDTPACTTWRELSPTVAVSLEDFRVLVAMALPVTTEQDALVERMAALLRGGEH